jgi:putative NIF3 family GTP cyclohydrolase 1 type 2
VDTERIMDLALQMSGLKDVPTDSGIWLPGKNIRRILFGLDITTAELQIASQSDYDLAIAHHPPEATLEAWRCYLRHVELMVAAGVPQSVAEASLADEIEGMQLRAHARNFEHTVSVARLIGMPFMNIHTPLDEIGRQRMQAEMDRLQASNPKATLADVVETLHHFGEVRHAPLPPFIAHGRDDRPAGRVYVAHGALDIPNYAMLAAYFAHGVDTIVVLRIDQKDLARLRREDGGAVVVVGHNAGDSIGIRPFVSALMKLGLEVVTISGILRA